MFYFIDLVNKLHKTKKKYYFFKQPKFPSVRGATINKAISVKGGGHQIRLVISDARFLEQNTFSMEVRIGIDFSF